jgi:hypothetical protein
MLEALEYARRGWRVFPCHGIVAPGWGIKIATCDCKLRSGCKDAGKHPACARGFLDATRNATVIRGWRSGSNVAIATGAASGLFVVDIDPRNGGGATLAKLEREHGAFSRDAVVVTGGGGLHLYFQYPRGGAPIASGGDVFGVGVDLKGDGGYVIAPPSLHASLKNYRWLRGAIPAKLPNAPAWLLKTARAGASSRASTPRDRSNLPGIKTREHPAGQAIAKLLNARDCGTYWKLDCPAGEHTTPDAAMYPRESGQVYFVCYSTKPCSDGQIKAAVRTLRSEQDIDE